MFKGLSVIKNYLRSYSPPLKVLSGCIKNKVDIKGTDLYNHSFSFTAYANDSIFFLKDTSSFKMLVETFKEFCFSGLKPNITKPEIASLGLLKGVLEAVCSFKTVD